MEKISPSKMRKAAFYAISYGYADAFINNLIHIKIALQHASTLAIALAKLIAAPTLGDFYEAAAAAWGQPSPNAAALQAGIKKGAKRMLLAHRQLTFSPASLNRKAMQRRTGGAAACTTGPAP